MTTTFFAEMGSARKAWEGAGGALVTGVMCGVAVDVNPWLYVAALVVTVVGGLPAGTQHRTLSGAALRGFAGGFFWGVALLATIVVLGSEPTAAFPDPLVLFLPIPIAVTVVTTTTVWALSARRAARRSSALGQIS